MPDDVRQRRNVIAARDAVGQVSPERDTQFSAGFFQAGEGVAALAASVTAGAAADFFLPDMITDIAFAAVMPTPGLCRVPRACGRNLREDPCSWSSDLSALSKPLKEGEQWIGSLVSRRHEAARVGVRECAFLESHVGMQVDLSRLRRFMTEPKRDHARVHSMP